jgi:hypothetical protein
VEFIIFIYKLQFMRKVLYKVTKFVQSENDSLSLNDITSTGMFHSWGTKVHGGGSSPFVSESVGIVEDNDSGEVFLVYPENITFLPNTLEQPKD